MEILFTRRIKTKKITVSPRPVWKCRSCPEYGIRPSCPPYTPHWKEAAEWISRYTWAQIIKFKLAGDNFQEEKREILLYLLEQEKEYFKKKHFYVHALFPGSCNLCEPCSCVQGSECENKKAVRPSVDAIGIELDKLVTIDFNENALYAIILPE
ncbi:MAG: DUF2284 domain-containing protein [bacterium]|nr:DUF2284 domain-containing protein [bacterium]